MTAVDQPQSILFLHGLVVSLVDSLLEDSSPISNHLTVAARIDTILLRLKLWKEEIMIGAPRGSSPFRILETEDPASADIICLYLREVYLAAKVLEAASSPTPSNDLPVSCTR